MKYVNLEKTLPISQPLLFQEEPQKTILYKKGIQIVKGKPNSGKSFYLSFLMAALTNENGLEGYTTSKESIKILFADTVKSRHNTHESIKRVHRLNKWDCNKNRENLIGINLRIYSADEQSSILEQAIQEIKPNVLFIDCIEETNKNLLRMMQWSSRYNLSIVAAFNTSSENNEKSKFRSIQQTDSIINITRDLNIISVTEQEREERNRIELFLEIKNELPVIRKSFTYNINEERIEFIIKHVLIRPMTNTELANAIAKYANRSQTTGFNYIKKAQEYSIIKMNNKGIYVIC